MHLRKTGNSLCLRCGTEYTKGTNWCRRCEGPVLRYGSKSWLADAGLKTFMVVFASLTLVALSFIVLKPIYAFIPTVCLLLILGGWKMLAAR
jgi:ribosomal protein L40E